MVHTESQTKKSRKERWESTAHIFKKTKDIDKPLKLLIVDDVLTTGATISSFIKEIESIHTIEIATIAVANDEH